MRLGVAGDALFGPVVFLARSAAGNACESGCVVALPPLKLMLAQDLVARSPFCRRARRERADAPAEGAQPGAGSSVTIADRIDHVASVELDPLHVEAAGVVAFDARIGLARSSA
ncbi:acetate--CoA ligase family protein [Accumulibacter sp.]|uniref:acetate--CoA ligase family protein n=1 Tax=Accumulibacter sp. TaxID=2053492 RepID=UPI0038FCF4CF